MAWQSLGELFFAASLWQFFLFAVYPATPDTQGRIGIRPDRITAKIYLLLKSKKLQKKIFLYFFSSSGRIRIRNCVLNTDLKDGLVGWAGSGPGSFLLLLPCHNVILIQIFRIDRHPGSFSRSGALKHRSGSVSNIPVAFICIISYTIIKNMNISNIRKVLLKIV